MRRQRPERPPGLALVVVRILLTFFLLAVLGIGVLSCLTDRAYRQEAEEFEERQREREREEADWREDRPSDR